MTTFYNSPDFINVSLVIFMISFSDLKLYAVKEKINNDNKKIRRIADGDVYLSGALYHLEEDTVRQRALLDALAKTEYTNSIIQYKIELLNLKIQTLWDFQTNTSYLPVDLLK